MSQSKDRQKKREQKRAKRKLKFKAHVKERNVALIGVKKRDRP